MSTICKVSARWDVVFENILNVLVGRESSVQVVYLYGVAGSGRTELLREILSTRAV